MINSIPLAASNVLKLVTALIAVALSSRDLVLNDYCLGKMMSRSVCLSFLCWPQFSVAECTICHLFVGSILKCLI